MKKVAIFGCSHSDWRGQYYNPIVTDKSHTSKFVEQTQGIWVKSMAKRFPDIKFYNFSKGGMGQLWNQMMYIYADKMMDVDFDLYIFQFSGWNRWYLPIENKFTLFDLFREHEMLENLIRMEIKSDFAILHMDSVTRKNLENSDITHSFPKGKIPENGNGNGSNAILQAATVLSYIHEESQRKPIYYFNYNNVTKKTTNQWMSKYNIPFNNIGLENGVREWFIDTRGMDGYAKLTDDSMHLTQEGNEIRFNEYIMNCNLGKKLLDLSNQ